MKKMALNIVYKQTSELIPYVNNARTHSEYQVNQIAASIKEFGFANPILIDGDNGVIAGHGRLLAAIKLKLETVPTIELSHLTPIQKKAYILADNKLAENSEWDFELVNIELKDLESLGFNIDVIGFDEWLGSEEKEPEKIEDVSEELQGAMALKPDMDLQSRLKWNIPELLPDMLAEIPKNIRTWAGPDVTDIEENDYYLWNWRTDSIKGWPKNNRVIGFYTDDYRFECLWEKPHIYTAKILNLGVEICLSPNFSLWNGQAEAVHLWSTYKSRWLARYFQEAGIKIIPDVNFANDKSFEFCLLGIPNNTPAIAIQLQTLKTDQEKRNSLNGIIKAIEILNPKSILVYGHKTSSDIMKKVNFKGEIVYLDNRTTLRRKVMR